MSMFIKFHWKNLFIWTLSTFEMWLMYLMYLHFSYMTWLRVRDMEKLEYL